MQWDYDTAATVAVHMQDSRNEHLFPMKSFHVRLVDDNVAAIYESSRFATSDLKEHPRLVRRAVALGRACIEPLTVLCTLMASSPAELLALQLHPLQVLHCLPPSSVFINETEALSMKSRLCLVVQQLLPKVYMFHHFLCGTASAAPVVNRAPRCNSQCLPWWLIPHAGVSSWNPGQPWVCGVP